MAQKRTTEEYIKLAQLKHNSFYDYSKTKYINKRTNIIITCPIHGDFEQNPNNHLRGQGCPKCAVNKIKNKRKKEQEVFINEVIEKYHNNFDLSKVNYINSKHKVELKCNICNNSFKIRPNDLLSGHGCPNCANLKKKKIYKKDEIINKFTKKFNGFYDYSLMNNEYENLNEYINIICPYHGIFSQRIINHLNGNGCKLCAIDKIKEIKKINKNEIDERLNHINHKLEIISKYNSLQDIVTIKCNECNQIFQRKLSSLLSNDTCPFCNKKILNQNRTKTSEEFISKANIIFNNFYDYSKVNYTKSNEKIEILCPKHGSFFITPNSHLMGHGCPYCNRNISKQEKELKDFIESLINKENIIYNSRNIIENNEIDIFIPKYMIAFEYNGLYWHNEINKENNYHLVKTKLCNEKGIQLIHIFEDEWLYKKDIVKSRITNLLGLNQYKIFARKCYIKELSYEESKQFLEKNHIQGNSISKIRIGLFHDNELVSIMTFGSLRKNLGCKNTKNTYELLRFCNKLNTTVIGGASKLLNYFIKTYNPEKIISYADKRWSKGNLYETLGFVLDHESKPNYFYVIKNKRINRFSLRKDVLMKKFNCPQNMSEHEFCLSKKWFRIYDAGCLCYVKKL